MDYPKTVDYILERNLMKCQQTKMAVLSFNCQIGVQMQSYLSTVVPTKSDSDMIFCLQH